MSREIDFHPFPRSYTRFNELEQTKGQEQIEAFVISPAVNYMESLALLCQLMDRHTQSRSMNQLKQEIQSAQTIFERDKAKHGYWNSMSSDSAYIQLLALRKDKRVKDRFGFGFSGGRQYHIDQALEFMLPTLGAIQRADKNLLNYDLIRTLYDSPAKENSFKSIQDSLMEAGFTPKDAEYQLAALSFLEYEARSRVREPILQAIERYSADQPIEFTRTDDKTPQDFMRQRLEKILLGDPRDGNNFGTEYYHGLLSRIAKTQWKLAEKLYGSENEAYLALFAIKSVLFMRTSQRQKDEDPKELRRRILEPLKNRDLIASVQAVKDIIFENPALYDPKIWTKAGYDRETMEHRIEGLLVQKQERETLLWEEKARLRQETREQARKRASEENALFWSERRNPELLEHIKPYQGKTGTVTGDRFSDGLEAFIVSGGAPEKYVLNIDILEPRAVKIRGEEGTRDGYLHIRYTESYYDPKTKTVRLRRSSRLQSYQTVLDHIHSGEWKFQEENETE